MRWQPVTTLQPGRLALLMFDNLQSAQWVGYVDREGFCDWPNNVRGMKPSGWQELLLDLSKMQDYEA